MAVDDRRSLIVNAVSYAGEQAARLGFAAIAGIFVARHLGPDGLGLLAYVSSVFGLLAPVVTLGLPSVLVREFGKESAWRPVLASVLVRQLAVAAVVAAAAFTVVGATRGWEARAVLTALVLLPLPFLSVDRTFRAFLEARARVRPIVVAGVAASALGAGLKLLGVAAGSEVWVIAAAVTVEASAVAFWLARAIPGRRSLRSVRRHADRELTRDLTREGLPFLLSAIAVTLYMRIDVTMLGLLVGDEGTGVYTAAVRLSEVWYFLPVAAVTAIRPRLSRLVDVDPVAYGRMLQRLLTGSVAVSYVVVALVLFFRGPLIAFLYGPVYAPSVPVLAIHVLATPFVFLGVAAGPWFVDHRMGRAVLVRTSFGAVLNIALNLLLLPAMGPRGAALATLVSYAVAGVVVNAFRVETRPVFRLQLRALSLRRT